MRAYRAVLNARFRAMLQYRAAAAAGFGCQLFWGLIRMMIFAAFYRASKGSQPMSYPEVVTYIWLGQAMFALLPFQPDGDVRQMINTGTVVYELLRPVDLYGLWYSRSIAQRTAPVLLRAAPMLVVAGLFFGLRPPDSIASGLWWTVSTTAAVMLSAAMTALLTISLLWTISGEGITRIAPLGVIVFSGSLLPIPLFPHWAQTVLAAMPFRGLMDTPFRIYMGHIPPESAPFLIVHQVVWTFAIILLGRWVLARGMRRLVAQGG